MNYDAIRPLFGGKLTQAQVDGIEKILSACKVLTDERHIAYILATCFHETAKTMQPVRENGRGKGLPYGSKLKMGGGPGHRVPYTNPDQLYYGRGYVQLTWYENYLAMGRKLHIDLLNNPDLALQPDISAKIMITGMTDGSFTGKKLSDYFNNKTNDPVNARRIINGTDVAATIAGYHNTFLKAITAS
ncbi:glycoside hydrolase family 19 protein [Mucilaginibacter gossypii]|uniref:glycoside hydrolase family 19 protein n=1 Tax=Mucilaginibacter gossypii TaxID=551996 RepID=UPI000DCB38E0|nr:MULTISPECIES: glycoside hydrolase family 19 protein [Mucilaginibacter]QTE37464.1 glycoside hydrolase family 19 protein [Mucilaginibacter gossypii]RAV47479.1 hypothetical protein DIU36_29465 [Mucilaginibacter rubeus]